MRNSSATIVALLGFAALGAWIALRRRANRSFVDHRGAGSRLEIDDDTAAEIIRRSLPALARARDLAVAR